jgi:hypothetical protein
VSAVSPRARELWRPIRRQLRECPRNKHSELITKDDALVLRGVLRELLCELGASPLLEPHRAGAAPWPWIHNSEQLTRWQLASQIADELDDALDDDYRHKVQRDLFRA